MRDKYALEYGKNSSYYARRFSYNKRLNIIKSFLRSSNCKDIIDIGSATGDYAIDLKKLGFNLTCVDINPNHLNVLRKKDRDLKLCEADVCSLPFDDNSKDLIIILNAFRYFINPELSLKECNRVLKDNGYFLLIEHNKYCPDTLFVKQNDVISYYSNKELIRLVESNNFRVIKQEMIYVPPPQASEKFVYWSDVIMQKFAFIFNYIFPEIFLYAKKEINK